MDFASVLSNIKDRSRGGSLFEILSGLKPEDINEAGKRSAIPADPGIAGGYEQTNAPAHSASAGGIASRLGPGMASLIGAAQEVPSGLSNLQEGKPFFSTSGESGFSLPDIAANATGIAKASPLAAMLSPTTMGMAGGSAILSLLKGDGQATGGAYGAGIQSLLDALRTGQAE